MSVLLFDGRDDFAVLGPAEALGLPGRSFTAEAWVRLAADAGTADLPIFGSDETAESAGLHLALRDRRPYFGFYGHDTGGRSRLPVETWVHLAFRFDAERGEQAIFVNGVLDSAAAGHPPFAGQGLVRLGRWAGAFHFAGALAEARLWGRALTVEEIVAGLYRRATGEEPGLTACWPLDDGSGARARNLKPALPARLSGGAGWAAAPTGGFVAPGGSLARLPGGGSEIVVPAATDLDLPRGADFTVEAWVAAEPAAADGGLRAVLGKRGESGAWPFFLGLNPGGHLVASRSDGASTVELSSLRPVDDGKLHHLALVRAGAELILYLDGEEEARAADAVSGRVGNAEPLRIGSLAGKSAFLTGLVSELRLWSRARSAAEVRDFAGRRLRGEEAGLLAYWPLDEGQGETARDARRRPEAEITGASWATAPPPPLLAAGPGPSPTAPALRFDGDGDHLALPAAKALDFPRGFTVEAWVRPARTTAEPFRLPAISCHGSASGFELRCSGDRAALMVTVDRQHHEVEAESGVAAERWLHLAGSFDGQTLALYLNGVLKASRPAAGAYTPYPDELRLGQSSFWTDRSFAGELAEVRLWERARSGEEILRDLHRRLTAAEAPGLLARWALDEAAGERAADGADGRFPGRLVGATWVAAELPPRLEAGGPTATAAPAAGAEAHALAKRHRELEAELEKGRQELVALQSRLDEAARLEAGLRAEAERLKGELAAASRLRTELEAERRARQDLEAAAQRQGEQAGAVSLAALIRNTNREIEQARSELAGRGGAYRLGRVTMELRMLPGPGGNGAIFPSAAEMEDLLQDQLSTLNLDFEAERPPEPPPPAKVPVPDLGGLTETVARRKLAEAGLLAETDFQAVPPAGAGKDLVGRVVQQLPAAGAPAAPSTTVRLFVGQAS